MQKSSGNAKRFQEDRTGSGPDTKHRKRDEANESTSEEAKLSSGMTDSFSDQYFSRQASASAPPRVASLALAREEVMTDHNIIYNRQSFATDRAVFPPMFPHSQLTLPGSSPAMPSQNERGLLTALIQQQAILNSSSQNNPLLTSLALQQSRNTNRLQTEESLAVLAQQQASSSRMNAASLVSSRLSQQQGSSFNTMRSEQVLAALSERQVNDAMHGQRELLSAIMRQRGSVPETLQTNQVLSTLSHQLSPNIQTNQHQVAQMLGAMGRQQESNLVQDGNQLAALLAQNLTWNQIEALQQPQSAVEEILRSQQGAMSHVQIPRMQAERPYYTGNSETERLTGLLRHPPPTDVDLLGIQRLPSLERTTQLPQRLLSVGMNSLRPQLTVSGSLETLGYSVSTPASTMMSRTLTESGNPFLSTSADMTANLSTATGETLASSAAGVSAAVQDATSGSICLATSSDIEKLSEYQIAIRQQLEFFVAQQEDVESSTQGRKKRVRLGQVGIRCRHCAHLPVSQRSRGAVYYPARLNSVYQAAQNMAVSHLCESCDQLDESIRQKLHSLRERRDTATGGKSYWAEACQKLGVYEADDGLRLSAQSANASRNSSRQAF